MTRKNHFIPLMIAALISVTPLATMACTNPTGVEGEQVYNASENAMQFCNGTNWVRMDGQGDQLWDNGGTVIYYQSAPAAIGTNTMNPADQNLLVDGRAQAAGVVSSGVNDSGTVRTSNVSQSIVIQPLSDTTRDALVSPATGQVIYNKDSNTLEVFDGQQWQQLPNTPVGADQTTCATIKDENPASVDGVYTIDPDGAGGVAAFNAYCDMSTDGGGWTMVDNDASASSCFTTRTAGANTDPLVTRGAYLPAYSWSDKPELLVKSNNYTGTLGWVTFMALTDRAKEYPTATTETIAGTGHWAVSTLNGNTNQGIDDWIYNANTRFGSVWIGYGSQPTAACCYETSGHTGLGQYNVNVTNTCSTWVR